MRIRWSRLPTAAALLALTACTGSGTPATAPPTSTAAATTTTTPPSTTTAATTSTTADRLTEIQQIFEDLERRRLDALYRGDVAAFSALFANEAYLQRSLEAFDLVEFTGPPVDGIFRVTAVAADYPDCVAVDVEVDYASFLAGAAPSTARYVIQRNSSGWGLTFIGDWDCLGDHPLSS